MSLTRKISSAIFGGRAHAFISDGTDDIVFDAVLSFAETDDYKVTEHAVESGGDISDHIDAKPKKISFTALLTDDDWSALDPTSFFNANIQERFNTLERWKIEKPVLTYYGHNTDIENLVLSSVSRNKSVDSGEGWEISVGMQYLNVAVSTTTETGISKSATTPKGATSKGTKTKEGKVTQKKSWAKKITGGLF